MDKISTEYLEGCLTTLNKSYSFIKEAEEGSVEYEMYRNALVKGFEMTLEQSGKLLKKCLLPFFASKKEVDKLSFKDAFRAAAKFSLIPQAAVERWFAYRDNRNNTAHDYGRAFAEETLVLIDNFILDVEDLKKVIENV